MIILSVWEDSTSLHSSGVTFTCLNVHISITPRTMASNDDVTPHSAARCLGNGI